MPSNSATRMGTVRPRESKRRSSFGVSEPPSTGRGNCVCPAATSSDAGVFVPSTVTSDSAIEPVHPVASSEAAPIFIGDETGHGGGLNASYGTCGASCSEARCAAAARSRPDSSMPVLSLPNRI